MARKRFMWLKDEVGKPTGVLVAVEKDNSVLRFGMVRYHPTKETTIFTKKRARNIALDRANKCTFVLGKEKVKDSRTHGIPEKYLKHVRYFMEQALLRLKASTFENVLET